MNLPEGVTAKFEYYRVANGFGFPKKKGKPNAYGLSRYYRGDGFAAGVMKKYEVGERGGEVVCNLFDEHDTCIGFGESTCSMSDHFCYKRGREIALGRALKALEA